MRRDMRRDLVDEFKARLIRMRDAGGFNDRSLSLKAGLGATAVRDILDGKSVEPRYSTIRRLAGALQCQLTDLVPDDPSWLPLPALSTTLASDCFADIVVERVVTACDEAITALKILDMPPERRASYVLRFCRWVVSEQRRTAAPEPASLNKLRELILFAIESNNP